MQPERSCFHCREMVWMTPEGARRMVTHRGYKDAGSDMRSKGHAVCEVTRTINSKPCDKWMRETGADDE